jgi:hypothetical protein
MTSKTSDMLHLEEYLSEQKECFSMPEEGSFKKLMNEDDDQTNLEHGLYPPLKTTVFDLAQTPLQSHEMTKAQAIQPSSEVQVILLEIISHLGLLTHEMTTQGVSETQLVISSESSLLDGVKIHVKQFDTAPGEINIEIIACSKLEALLHSHDRSLMTQLHCQMPEIKINRFEINGHTLGLKSKNDDKRQIKKLQEAK